MAEPRQDRDVVIKVFVRTDAGKVPVHAEGGILSSSERRFAEKLLAGIEARQHLGRELRNRVVEGQGLEKGTELDPFDPRSEHNWRLGI